MLSNAVPLVQRDPVIFIRTAPIVMLRYMVDSTSFVAPENVMISSQEFSSKLAVREEQESTAGSASFSIIY